MKTLDLDFFQLIIIFASAQALIFSLVVFFNKKYNTRANIYLGLMIFFTVISNIQHMLIDMNYLGEESIIRKIYLPIQWLILPMFYLHVYEFVYKIKAPYSKKTLLFSPFVTVTVLHVVHFFFYRQQISIRFLPDYDDPGFLLYTNLASFVFGGLVIFYVFRMISGKQNSSKNKTVEFKRKILLYRRLIKSSTIILGIGTLIITYVIAIGVALTYTSYLFHILVSLVIYWVGYMGIVKGGLVTFVGRGGKTGGKGMSMFNKIRDFIIMERQYLNTDLTLNSIANNFDISPGYTSQLINLHARKSFNDFVNEKRIEESRRMLVNQQYEHYTIESIGLECGFKSKSNFYTSFKKFTGQSPSQYRKKNMS